MNAINATNVTAQARLQLSDEIGKVEITDVEGMDGLSENAVKNMLVEKLGEEMIKTVLDTMPNAAQFIKDKVELAIRDAMAGMTSTVSPEQQVAANDNEAAKTLVDGIVEEVSVEVGAAIQAEIGDISQIDDTSIRADSWLLVLAQILGKIADQKLDNLLKAGEALGGLSEGDDAYGTASSNLTASAKIFTIVMEATVNVIKTTGDGITTAARK